MRCILRVLNWLKNLNIKLTSVTHMKQPLLKVRSLYTEDMEYFAHFSLVR